MKSAALIDFSNVYSFSVRSISSYLKNKGFRVSTVHYYASKKDDIFSLPSEDSLKRLAEYCRNYDIVGISLLTTHYLRRAIRINNYLKDKIKATVIWGGVPVICDPYFYLKYADYICVGDGETVIANLLEEKSHADIPGLGYKSKDGKFVINDIPPPLNLNEMPIPYLDLENTFMLNMRKDDKITSLKENPEPLFSVSAKGYRIFPIRGCPYSCTFCSNNRLKEVFRGKGPFLRFIKPSRIIAELENAKEIIPDLKKVMFYEDDFMSRAEHELEELLIAYSHKIALPFNINATINNLTEPKLNLIIGGGMKLEYVKIGLQSASTKVNKEVFRRYFNREIYLQRLEMLASKGIPVILDIISDNPYETLSDKYESFLFYYNLSKRLKRTSIINRPIRVMDHKLMFYPGTELYDKALADRIINDNYIDKVLLTRRTTRDKTEDMDNDAFILALFGQAVKKNDIGIANIIFEILQIRQIFKFMYSLNIFKYFVVIAKGLRNLLKTMRVKFSLRNITLNAKTRC